METGNKNVVRQFVARAVFVKNGQVLMANKIGESHLFVPGGRIEPGESATEAVVREIKEELGLTCKINKYLGAIEHSFVNNNKNYYEIGHFFEVEISGVDDVKPKSAEKEMQFFWVKLDELDGKDIKPKSVVDLLNKILGGAEINSYWNSTLK